MKKNKVKETGIHCDICYCRDHWIERLYTNRLEKEVARCYCCGNELWRLEHEKEVEKLK